jgi:hypothetical protein
LSELPKLLTLLYLFFVVDCPEEDKPLAATIVTLECAAVLPNSEAEDVVKHIEAVWERGKLAIDALRDCLGPELRDILCPLRNGGISLHKLYGVMHDTCNCANKVGRYLTFDPTLLSCSNTCTFFFPKVAKLMLAVRDRKCREHYGEDHWSRAEPKTKACFDFLCGNHTRNLPVVCFNKVLFLSPKCESHQYMQPLRNNSTGIQQVDTD